VSSVIVAAVAGVVALVATPAAMALARATGTVDRPGHLKRQSQAVPYLGGLAVFAGVAAGMVAAHDGARFTRHWTLLLPLAAALALGTADDRVELSPRLRLLGQIGVGLGIAAVVRVRPPGPLGPVLVVLATIVVLNGVNLVDGLDALAATTTGVAAAGFAVLLPEPGRALGIALAFALCGFIPYNAPPARVYLGDGGAYLLGATLTTLLALAWGRHAGGAGAAPAAVAVAGLCLVAIFAAELAFAMVRRARAGAPVMSGDRRHPYDLLVAAGWSVATTSLVYATTETVITAAALVAAEWSGTAATVVVACAVAAALTGTAAALGALSPDGSDRGAT
jgi:UDP-GlcNAc:undecaprenyl-phosphate GlcNAc-1-phosphate transferase